MRRQHTEFAVLLALFVVLELLLDALAGDWLKQWIQQHFGTIPAALGFVAVLALIWVRVSKYEALAGMSGRKKGKGGKRKKG
ncbi:TPA_asm: hypothetical protein GahPV1_gp30 [Geoglobus ahangari pleomorphic virus 1]|uniref:Uncharacterized protein n=2 Tax=root TaxID=1 RepID=A0A0F7IJJ2_9EURY|nr:hypothetical protein [Geoglobus ahangari]AKG92394.1 hypothetical protein GAH_00250 [Geoglobus ahangari]